VTLDRPFPPDLIDSTLQVDGRVATLLLERDDVRNALTGTRLSEEVRRVACWANDADVSVLVITGVGRAFSAGGNVNDMRDRRSPFKGSPYELQHGYRRGIQQMALALHRLEIPSIAAINGAAIGAGFDLACMCDIRLATDEAVLGETFIDLGLIAGDGGAWYLQRLVGCQRAAELTFTGRRFSAAEAQQLGIVVEVVAPDDLLSRALELATDIAAKPPQALRLAKRLLKTAQQVEFEAALDLSAALQAICHYTDDHHEAVAAFVDRRAPRFQGH
jgi:enoyl-CoA hydratase/carnithine racemase